MSKRMRTHGTRRQRPVMRGARPIDKQIIGVNKSVSTAQLVTTLFTATFPCTVVGIRWDLSSLNSIASTNTLLWALVLVKEGETVDTLGLADSAPLYNPEQNVIAHGVHLFPPAGVAGGPVSREEEGSTKSMRKLQGGDQLQLLFLASSASVEVQGTVQFFCKG